MQPRASKALVLLGGVATLALATSFVLRLSPPGPRAPQTPCAPRMLELERAVCEPVLAAKPAGELAELSIRPAR